MVAILDIELNQMDVITAFLHGLLDVEIYVAQLEGFVLKDIQDLVCLLLRSLYVLIKVLDSGIRDLTPLCCQRGSQGVNMTVAFT